MKKTLTINHMLVIFSIILIGLIWLNSKLQPNVDKIHAIYHPNEAKMHK